MPSVDLVVGTDGQLTLAAAHRMLRPAVDDDVSVIDLSRLRWVEPAGLVLVATVSEAAVRQGREVEVVTPLDRTRANYVARMRLGLVLDDLGVTHDLSGVREHDVGQSLLELQRFEGANQAEGLAGLVYNSLDRDAQLAQDMHVSVFEMSRNVPDHSALTHGYVAAQATYGGEVIHFAIGDSGRGLRDSLSEREDLGEVDALHAVLRPGGLTRRLDGHGGRGIPTTKRLVTERGGSLQLASGSTLVTAYRGDQILTRSHPVHVEGTLIQGAMRCG